MIMLRSQFTTGMLLAAACGVGLVSSDAQAFVTTEAIEASGGNRVSAIDHTSTPQHDLSGYDDLLLLSKALQQSACPEVSL